MNRYREGEAKLKGSGRTVPPLAAIKNPLRDGDIERPDDPTYTHAYFINANASTASGIVDSKLAHGGHPVLRWMMDNIFVRTDPAGNIKPDKEKSTERIDGAVATIMALDRAIRNGGGTSSSIYDDRGLLIL